MHTVRDTQPQLVSPATSATTVDRFELLERIGAGGMGEVFRAFDPQLNRLVALKLPKRSDRRDTDALLREAKAMAQVSHPNVVSVFDAGLDGEQPWVAMELIRGTTLREWLGTPHGWPDTLRVLCQIGRGLQAAHRADLVHRDLKPENVMIGADGRVAVTDFGIAQAPWAEPRHELATPSLSAAAGATPFNGQHAASGTPGYMAPEQRLRQPTDARSDQFAFGVTAFEALTGIVPAPGQKGPTGSTVPQAVWRVLERTLSTDPNRRYPSMGEVLTDLEAALPRRRSPWSIALGVAAVVLSGTSLWGVVRAAPIDPCTSASARLLEPWGPERQRAVEAAFEATSLPYARQAWGGVRSQLDAYAGDWATMYRETCRATLHEGRQSDSLMDVRMTCLERRRGVLAQLTQLWAAGMDADAVEHAARAARNLSPIADCADGHALNEWATPRAGPAPQVEVVAARKRLDAIEALALAHRLQEAHAAVVELRDEISATAPAHLLAELAYDQGTILVDLGDPTAEKALLESARLAQSTHDDLLAARALVRLSWSLASAHQSPDRALLTIELAEGQVARAADPSLHAALLRAKAMALSAGGKNVEATTLLLEANELFRAAGLAGEVLTTTSQLVLVTLAKGQYAAARALGEENLTATIALDGPDHPEVAAALNSLANAAGDGDDQQAAAGYLRRALAINERNTGPDSAATAWSLNSLGAAERVNGHLAEAQALLERAIAIRERVLGPDNPVLAASLTNLGDVRRRQGFLTEAAALDRRALDISIKALGPSHVRVAMGWHKLGQVIEAQGGLDGALEAYRQSLTIRTTVLGPEHPMTYFSMTLVGDVLARQHRCAKARPLLEKAQAGLEKTVGTTHSDFVDTFGPLAACDLFEGHPAKARERLERALAIEEQTHPGRGERGAERFLLAQALWSLGKRPAALDVAAQAERALTDAVPLDRRAAQAWLASRR